MVVALRSDVDGGDLAGRDGEVLPVPLPVVGAFEPADGAEVAVRELQPAFERIHQTQCRLVER